MPTYDFRNERYQNVQRLQKPTLASFLPILHWYSKSEQWTLSVSYHKDYLKRWTEKLFFLADFSDFRPIMQIGYGEQTFILYNVFIFFLICPFSDFTFESEALWFFT